MKVKENSMERKCIFCETPIDIKKHGLTKFCSANCRNKYYYQNKMQKYNQDQKNLINSDEAIAYETTKVEEKNFGNVKQPDLPINTATRGNDNFIYTLIEAKFDAKNECNLYKLKCEQLEEDKRRLEKELFDANTEIDSFEESDSDGPLSFLSGLPENIVAGVSKAAFENPQIREIISTLVSSKK